MNETIIESESNDYSTNNESISSTNKSLRDQDTTANHYSSQACYEDQLSTTSAARSTSCVAARRDQINPVQTYVWAEIKPPISSAEDTGDGGGSASLPSVGVRHQRQASKRSRRSRGESTQQGGSRDDGGKPVVG